MTSGTTRKLVLTVAAVAAILIVRLILGLLIRAVQRHHPHSRAAFWTEQGASLTALAFVVLAGLWIWVDEPAQFTSVLGLAAAGVAIAAQKAVTAFAAYLIIMRGKTFTVGDRIKMGGVRGDVISLPREFPFIWEQMHIPVPYRADRERAEKILLDAARSANERTSEDAKQACERGQRKYGAPIESLDPRTFWHLTDNWIEITLRFIAPEHGIREIKDRISRDILRGFDAAGIEVASSTMEISRVAPITIERSRSRGDAS